MALQVKSAVATIEESRASHISWVRWLKRHGWPRRRPQWLRLAVSYGGGLAHHQRCINDYDLVLRVLRDVGGRSKSLSRAR